MLARSCCLSRDNDWDEDIIKHNSSGCLKRCKVLLPFAMQQEDGVRKNDIKDACRVEKGKGKEFRLFELQAIFKSQQKTLSLLRLSTLYLERCVALMV